MRKAVVLALVLILACAAGASAFEIGIGAEYLFYTPGLASNALLSLRAWPAPFQLGLGFAPGPRFSITGDWWLKAGGISGSPLGYYVAVGGFVTLPGVAFGARIPLGLQLWLLGDLLELFIEAVPYAGLFVTPTTGIYGVGLGAGFRFWF
jgi:hypothetical protein